MGDEATGSTRKAVVVRSVNLDGETRCVDVFRRPDGTFGFEEYRRDLEDGRGWFAIGQNAERIYCSEREALTAARGAVAWLASVHGLALEGKAEQ